MFKQKIVLLLVGVLLLSICPVFAASVSNVVIGSENIKDAHVAIDFKNTSYPSNSTMNIKNQNLAGTHRNGYFKVDFNSYNYSTVANARLWLYCTSTNVATGRTFSIYGLNDDNWADTTITWNNIPSQDGMTTAIQATLTPSLLTGHWVGFNVTDYINAQMIDKIASFKIIGPSLLGGYDFATTDNTDSSIRPRLEIINVGAYEYEPVVTTPKSLIMEDFEGPYGKGAWKELNSSYPFELTTEKFHSGSKSIKTSQSGTYSLIKELNVSYENAVVSVWMYDDKNITSMVDCGVMVDNAISGPVRLYMGVNSTASYYMYSIYWINGKLPVSGGTKNVTSVPRTTGWHKFTYDYSKANSVKLYIDDTLVLDSDGSTEIDTSFKTFATTNSYSYSVQALTIGQQQSNRMNTGFFFDDIELFFPGAYIEGPDTVIANSNKIIQYTDASCDAFRQPLQDSAWEIITDSENDNVSFDVNTKELTVNSALDETVNIKFKATNSGSEYIKSITIHPSRSRKLLYENFESFDVENLVPQWEANGVVNDSISNQGGKSGIKSYEPLGNSVESLTYTVENPVNARVDVWMYDDTVNSDFQNSVMVKDANNKLIGAGVYNVNPTGTDNKNSVYVIHFNSVYRTTNIGRSTGWHKITFDFSADIRTSIFIDDKLVMDSDKDLAFKSYVGGMNIKSIILGQTNALALKTGCKFDDLSVYYTNPYDMEIVRNEQGISIDFILENKDDIQSDNLLGIGIYKNGKMEKCDIDTMILNPGKQSEFSCNVSLNSDLIDANVKVFLWGGLSGMEPLLEETDY